MLRAQDTLRGLWATGSGRVGLSFFALLVILSIIVVGTYPLDFGTRVWSNPAVWADYPKAAPPAWVNAFSSARQPEHLLFVTRQPTAAQPNDAGQLLLYRFPFEFRADEPPTFLSVTVAEVTYYTRPSVLTVTLERPDAGRVVLHSFVLSGPIGAEQPPFRRHHETPRRIAVTSESSAIAATAEFVRNVFGVSVSERDLAIRGIEPLLFGVPQEPGSPSFRTLPGAYTLEVRAQLFDARDSVGRMQAVVGGATFGALGTDSLGRDLGVGLLFGFPIALFIGLVTSVLTTLVGALLGVYSGYVGGKTDTSVQRGADVLNNIPLLPILIFLVFLFGQKLWVVILVLIVFSWPGLTVIIRSMVLQIKTAQFVEAAVTLGAPRRHIMLRHVLPQTAPFLLAQLIFFAPSAILAEAALSFLGLGDPSLPTWGQILQQGFSSGGVYVGFWWWVLPPGLLIIYTAMTFVLISLAVEPLVNPRLRRRT